MDLAAMKHERLSPFTLWIDQFFDVASGAAQVESVRHERGKIVGTALDQIRWIINRLQHTARAIARLEDDDFAIGSFIFESDGCRQARDATTQHNDSTFGCR